MQGSFSVWISHKKGPTRMKELARFKPTQRHLFLYERALLFCKCREEHGEGADKTPSYSFKHCLKMSAVGITENVKGDVKKFEIWYSGREEVYAVQAPTVEVKTAWLGELRRILTNQQKLLKDERRVDIQMPDHIRRSPPMSERSVLQTDTLMNQELDKSRPYLSMRRHVSAVYQARAHTVFVAASTWSMSDEVGEHRVSSFIVSLPTANSRGRRSAQRTQSGRSSPDPQSLSPNHQRNRHSGPGTPHTMDICLGLKEWGGGQDPFHQSDTEEEDTAQLAPGRYKASAECPRDGPDDLAIESGDVIQLQHEDSEGHWLVKNLSRRQKSLLPLPNLHVVLGHSRRGDPGNLKARKLSSPERTNAAFKCLWELGNFTV
ncbi:unnamed protein product [Oncorhynchus mykiss]|uniref:SH3 domain-containing protein n=1 Tax=Oncorhynchus mykiss TaxID=8022 RepID=A0A060WN54_ONCMY|nr:unnamed protein product [Oncorhynchus mykiss]